MSALPTFDGLVIAGLNLVTVDSAHSPATYGTLQRVQPLQTISGLLAR